MTRTDSHRTHASSAPVATWRYFVSVLTVWGAGLGGLSIAVLPKDAFISELFALTFAKPLAGVSAALLGALCAGLVANILAGHARKRSGSRISVRTSAPSGANEYPIEDEPPASMGMSAGAGRSTSFPADAPREYSLTEFAALPGRNAVWVRDDGDADAKPALGRLEPELEPQPPVPAVVRAKPGGVGPTRALAKLRGTPTRALGLVQMVERFAAGLNEHRDTGRAPSVEPGLADALKALIPSSHAQREGYASIGTMEARLETNESALRDALRKLNALGVPEIDWPQTDRPRTNWSRGDAG